MTTNICPNATTATAPTVPTGTHLAEFFSRIDPVRGRLIFALDATASRQPTWDHAAQLQAQMFETVAAIGGLDVQLIFYKGYGECVASRWFADSKSLASVMSRVTCAAGQTQIKKVLVHGGKENARQKVNALVLVSDACEETPHDLYAQARELANVPVFAFQEGADEHVGRVYAEIARITGGASCKFDTGSAQRLGDLLKAVAVFATGGVKALALQKTQAATLLLTQMKAGGRR
jgi:hypothetical protein